jgi:hypothetical protein
VCRHRGNQRSAAAADDDYLTVITHTDYPLCLIVFTFGRENPFTGLDPLSSSFNQIAAPALLSTGTRPVKIIHLII